MKRIIEIFKRLFKKSTYRAPDRTHVFVGADPEGGVIGLILETPTEEIELRLEPYKALALMQSIEEMLTELEV